MSSVSSSSFILVKKKAPKNIILTSPSNTRIKSPNEIEIEKNLQDQQLIENDVIISYKSVPIVADEIKKIVKNFNVDQKKIKSSESFVDKKKNFFIIISFKDKKSQEELLRASKKEKQFFIRERLTKFNAKVHRELQHLFNIATINSYKRDEPMFEVRIDENDKWLTISCESVLTKLVNDTKHIEYTKKDEKIEENHKNQLKFHNKVILEGFDIENYKYQKIVENFMEIFNLNDDEIVNVKPYIKTCQILIEMKDKCTHMKVLKQASSKILHQSDFVGNKSHKNDPIITITHPLTKFNENVRTELVKAIKDKKIVKFELYDQCYRYKSSEHSKWISIKSQDDLKKFTTT